MILLVCFIVAVAMTAVAVIFNDDWGVKAYFFSIGLVIGVLAWFTVAVMGIIAIFVNIGVKGDVGAKQQLYESLVYQLENDLYDNDNDIGKQELYTKVTKWNMDLARGKAMQHDFWFGIFYPNIYDEFEFIQLPET